MDNMNISGYATGDRQCGPAELSLKGSEASQVAPAVPLRPTTGSHQLMLLVCSLYDIYFMTIQ